MTNSLVQLILSVMVFAILLTLVLLVRKLPSTPQKRLTQRLREATELRIISDAEVDGELDDLTDGKTVLQKVTQRLIAIGDMIPLLDAKQRSALGMQLTRAGFRERKAVSVLVGIKLVVGAAASFAAALFASSIPFVNEHFFMMRRRSDGRHGGILILGAHFSGDGAEHRHRQAAKKNLRLFARRARPAGDLHQCG